MISKPYTKAELAAQLQLKGKELTAHIRQLKQAGKLLARRVHCTPFTKAKHTVFNFVATDQNLPGIEQPATIQGAANVQ